MSFIIPSSVWTKYYEMADVFISDNQIGKNCTLYYQPIWNECTNCTVNHFGGTSTNSYRHGGAAPFNGKCPLCGGSGRREEETTGSIRLRIYHSRRDWIKVNNINIPDATVQIIGYAIDLPNLLRANEVRLISEQNVLDQRYQLAGAPFLHGFGHNRYFIAHLKRV